MGYIGKFGKLLEVELKKKLILGIASFSDRSGTVIICKLRTKLLPKCPQQALSINPISYFICCFK